MMYIDQCGSLAASVYSVTHILLDSLANSYFTFDMALRVLLADESSTIKKVMQLALSDFAVEVKSVPVGLDVLSVAKTFKPDIVFADVLLTKRSGYEVCQDLKTDPYTEHIPVVLMWSGFMEIDEAKTQNSRADRRLEKPFDAEHLRSIVTDLVQKTKTNPVSDFLTFPSMPDFEESANSSTMETLPDEEIPARENSKSDIYALPEVDENTYDQDFNVPGEEFSAVPLTTPRAQEETHEEGGWAHQDLTKFKIQLPEVESADFGSKFVIPQEEEIDASQFEEISFGSASLEPAPRTAPRPASPPSPAAIPAQAKPSVDSFINNVERSVKDQMLETLQKRAPARPSTDSVEAQQKPAVAAKPNAQSKVDLDANMMEKVIREEARAVIETICWKVLPEIAERIVREELNKLLKETEKSI